MTTSRRHAFWTAFLGLLAPAAASLVLSLPPPVFAGDTSEASFWDQFKDPEDGKFDIIGSRESASGFLPLIIPFNEPAVGIGAAGALAFFHPRDASATVGKNPEELPPPSISFAGGLYTENKSWALAAGHYGVWKQGSLRYLGGLAYASINLDFYGIGNDPEENRNPIPLKLQGGGTVQQLQLRLGESAFFVSGRYVFAAVDGSFRTTEEIENEGYSHNAGLSLFTSYDTRDNVFTPGRGTRTIVGLSYFGQLLGGDFSYGRLDVLANQFIRIGTPFILGLRLEYHQTGHEAPFYSLPWVRLRGVPAFRYLGYNVVTGEIEPRWRIDERWSLLVFSGFGRAATSIERLKDAENAYNFGGGFRYLIARSLGLAMGLDFARGPDETTTYLTVGSAW